jgi:hypothetical protein
MSFESKILIASNVRKTHKIYSVLSENLAAIDELKYVKIYKGRVMASNAISENGKNKPITEVGKENIVGVEILVNVSSKIVQFFSLTSSIKGCGQKIVKSVLDATPNDWKVVVVMDWSGGFWPVMVERYPRLEVF